MIDVLSKWMTFELARASEMKERNYGYSYYHGVPHRFSAWDVHLGGIELTSFIMLLRSRPFLIHYSALITITESAFVSHYSPLTVTLE